MVVRSNLSAIRQRVERLANSVTSRVDWERMIQIIRAGRTRQRAQPFAELTIEAQRKRARAFRDRTRALGVLPPLREPRGSA